MYCSTRADINRDDAEEGIRGKPASLLEAPFLTCSHIDFENTNLPVGSTKEPETTGFPPGCAGQKSKYFHL